MDLIDSPDRTHNSNVIGSDAASATRESTGHSWSERTGPCCLCRNRKMDLKNWVRLLSCVDRSKRSSGAPESCGSLLGTIWSPGISTRSAPRPLPAAPGPRTKCPRTSSTCKSFPSRMESEQPFVSSSTSGSNSAIGATSPQPPCGSGILSGASG